MRMEDANEDNYDYNGVDKMILELDDVHVAEVFEILCNLLFEAATMHDIEPRLKSGAWFSI